MPRCQQCKRGEALFLQLLDSGNGRKDRQLVCATCDRKLGRNNLLISGMSLEEIMAWEKEVKALGEWRSTREPKLTSATMAKKCLNVLLVIFKGWGMSDALDAARTKEERGQSSAWHKGRVDAMAAVIRLLRAYLLELTKEPMMPDNKWPFISRILTDIDVWPPIDDRQLDAIHKVLGYVPIEKLKDCAQECERARGKRDK